MVIIGDSKVIVIVMVILTIMRQSSTLESEQYCKKTYLGRRDIKCLGNNNYHYHYYYYYH